MYTLFCWPEMVLYLEKFKNFASGFIVIFKNCLSEKCLIWRCIVYFDQHLGATQSYGGWNILALKAEEEKARTLKQNFAIKMCFFKLQQNAGQGFYQKKTKNDPNLVYVKMCFYHRKGVFLGKNLRPALECTAPKCWSKYTTEVFYIEGWL